ncbi:hypothetical protein JCM10599A_29670 [Paraburkholderia kururiensis]
MDTRETIGNYPPNCPKCGARSIAPTRAGMSATPYKCTGADCGQFFGPFIDAAGTFFLDVRDGTLEQHLANGEVRTFPPANGKSVSPLMVELHASRHTVPPATTRDGMSALRRRGASEPRQRAGSRLLASLLSRQ